MLVRFSILVLSICAAVVPAFGLAPVEIVVIANENNPASIRIAQYYCEKRGVPQDNILKLRLNEPLADSISRADYDKFIAGPVRIMLLCPEFSEKIKCLLTVYGVPFKVGGRGVLTGETENLRTLQEMLRQKTLRLNEIIEQLENLGDARQTQKEQPGKTATLNKTLEQLNSYVESARLRIERTDDILERHRRFREWLILFAELYGSGKAWQDAQKQVNLSIQLPDAERIERDKCTETLARSRREKWDYSRRIKEGFYASVEKVAGINSLLLYLNVDTDCIKGSETDACVDSELSMVMFDDYELYRWQPNELKERLFWSNVKTLMVARLDGPSENIATGLIDKAISAERNSLKGIAYIDSGKKGDRLYADFDEYLRETALMIQKRIGMEVVEDRTTEVFGPGRCPRTALYCGWYSLKKYVDAFDFVDGAIGYHIASLEAVNLRDSKSSQWCPSMLADGITATLGAVAEPYLQAFPRPKAFFTQIANGKCLAEAYYRTKPYNSWQMTLIGDPLYTPFP